MGAHFSIKPGPVGGGPANVSYITRSQAAEEGNEVYHNAPESVENADTWHETKIRFRSWAERVKAEEVARHGNRAGRPRTHYRAVISYEDEIPTEAVKEDVEEFLEKEFPQAKAVAVVQQDTDHSHAHVWMSARKTNGKKVHIGNGDLKEMHATMDEIYERRTGVQSRNAEKVEETKEFKREYARRRESGASEWELFRYALTNRPIRATPPGPEVYRKREKRLAGEGLIEDAEDQLEESRAQEMEQAKEIISEAKNRLEDSYEHQQAEAERAEPGADRGGASPERGEREGDFREQAASRGTEGADQRISGGESQSGRRRGRQAGEQAKRGAGRSEDGHSRSRDRSHVDNSDRGGGSSMAGSSGDSAPEMGNDRGGVGGSDSLSSDSGRPGVEGDSEQLEDQDEDQDEEAWNPEEWDWEHYLRKELGASSDQVELLRRVLREDTEEREDLLSGLDLRREGVKEAHDFLAEYTDRYSLSPTEHRVSEEWEKSDQFRLRLGGEEGRIRPALERGEFLEAVEAFRELDSERRYGVWESLVEAEKKEVYQGVAELRRREAGTQSAYEALPEEEQDIARSIHLRSLRGKDVAGLAEDLEELVDSTEDLSEKAYQIQFALPSKATVRILREASKQAKEAIEQSQDRSHDSSRSRGGGRGGRSRGGRGGIGR